LPVQEDHLDPGAVEFVDQQHLIGVASRQPVGRVDIEPIQIAGGNRIAQPLQRRPHQSGAAIALIGEAVVRLQRQTVLDDLRRERGDLADDGLVCALLLGRDASIKGGAEHAYLLLIGARSSGRAWRGGPHAGG
jgi:hypothetical protein